MARQRIIRSSKIKEERCLQKAICAMGSSKSISSNEGQSDAPRFDNGAAAECWWVDTCNYLA